MKDKNTKILFLSTVHNYPDLRIINKELYSLKENYTNLFYIGQHSSAESFYENEIKVIPLKIVINRFDRIFKLQYDAYQQIIIIKPNIIHFHDPELIPLMWFLKKKLKLKVIFDVHESVAESFKDKVWLPKFARKVLPCIYSFLEKYLIKNFDEIIIVKESFWKIYGNGAIVIKNFPKIILAKSLSNKDFSGHLNLVYAGVITEDRGIFTILNVFNKLLEFNYDISLTLIGRVDSSELETKIINFINENNLKTKIILTGQIAISDVYEILKNSHFGFSLLRPTISYKNAISTKIFDYMANSIPYIVSNFKIYNEFTVNADTGITANYEDVTEITDKVFKLLNDRSRLNQLGKNGFKMVKTKWNWKSEEVKLLNLYKKVLNQN